MVSEGVPEEVIREKWGLGGVQRVVHLREHNYYDGVDHGCDYTGLRITCLTTGRRNRAGTGGSRRRTALAPEAEPAVREAVREYTESRPPVAPKGVQAWWKRAPRSMGTCTLNMQRSRNRGGGERDSDTAAGRPLACLVNV